jgi:DNA-directed RNA polymerase specialized sigma24 family protein
MGNDMRRAHAESSERWHQFFSEQHSVLAFAARTLLRRGQTEAVLSEALETLQGSTPSENYWHAFAMRTVVKAAISQNLESSLSDKVVDISSYESREDLEALQMAGLPWAERAVYFLRKVLRYSRRDTALLMRMSDSNVDQLLMFAEKRIGRNEDARQLKLKRWNTKVPNFIASRPPTSYLSKTRALTTD